MCIKTGSKNIFGKYYCDSDGVIYSGSKILKQYDNGKGYKYVSLYKNGKRKNHYVHRLVATIYVLATPGKDHVNHIDGDKSNNNYKNLEWCTPQENMDHKVKNNLTARGLKINSAKLSDSHVVEIIKSNLSQTDLAKMYNVSRKTIYNIKNGKTHKYLR